MGREHVDTAAVVNAVCVGFPPRALRNVYYARQNARRNSGWDDQLTAVIPHADKVAVVDISCGGVNRVDENSLRECLLQPVVVGVRGMDSRKCVMSDSLQSVFALSGAARTWRRSRRACGHKRGLRLSLSPKRMFPFLNIFRHGGDFVGIAHVVQLFGEDFNFAAGRIERIFQRVGAEIGEGDFWIRDRVGICAKILFDEFIESRQVRKTS